MALAANPDDDEIKLIIARAAMAVPLTSLKSNKEPPKTKGEQMKLIIENMTIQHDQIRKQIFAQCPRSIPPSTFAKIRTQAFGTQRNPKGLGDVQQEILELLRVPYSAPGARFALPPVEPNQPYGKPLPQTQSSEMQPFLHELAPILKALDTFNFHAFHELKRAEEQRENLESNHMARTPLVTATAKKRSALDANLDKQYERPPMKRSATSSAKEVERPTAKRSVSFAQTEQDIMSEKRQEEKIKLENLSPILQMSKLPAKLPDRSRSPLPAPIKDPRPSSTDYKPSPYASNGSSNYSLNNGNSRPNGEPGTSGMRGTAATNRTHDSDPALSSSPSGNIHPSRMALVQFSPPTSPAKPRPIPRPSSRDPRLIHKRSSLDNR